MAERSRRDRWSAYAEATTAAAPQATQVADRWHLLKNLREAVDRHRPDTPPTVIIYHKGQRIGSARLLDPVANRLRRRKE